MTKTLKISLIIIGVLLGLNGLLNIFDDASVKTYDITSILSGIGFMLLGFIKKSS